VRLLVIRRRCLGDIVLLGSFLKNLRLHWPFADIALLTNPAYASAGALHATVDRTYAFPEKLTQRLRLIYALRRARFTHVFDFDNATTTSLVTWLSAAPVRVTYDREGFRLRRSWAYTRIAKIPARDFHTLHITESYLALLPAAGIPICTRDPQLSPSQADIAHVQKFARPPTPATTHAALALQQNRALPQRPRVLVHPGASRTARVWPLERFAAVCDRIATECGAEVFLVAGPDERSAARAIREAAHTAPTVIDEPLAIGQFAALCRHFDLFLCNDSGPMHTAACMGTRVVALFGAQNKLLWGPIGGEAHGHTILQTERPCPCIADAPCPCVKSDDPDQSYCVRRLSVECVFEAVRRAL